MKEEDLIRLEEKIDRVLKILENNLENNKEKNEKEKEIPLKAFIDRSPYYDTIDVYSEGSFMKIYKDYFG